MRHFRKSIAAILILGIAASCQDKPHDVEHLGSDSAVAMAPGNREVISAETRAIKGQSFTSMKVLDENAEIKGVILDANGNAIDESALPRVRPSKISRELRAAIDERTGSAARRGGREPLWVVVALSDDPDMDTEPMEWGNAIIDSQGNAQVTRNGVHVTEAEIEAAQEEKYARIVARREARLDRSRAKLRALSRRVAKLAGDPGIVEALAHGRSSVTATLEAGEVDAFLRENDDLVAGLELESRSHDTLAEAMRDTNIDPHALQYSERRGSGIGIYMSEGGCPPSGHISNYLRLSGLATDHSKNVSAILRGVSPDSYVYCRGGSVLPNAADLNGYNGNPRVYVENYSFMETLTTPDYRIRDMELDNHVYDEAVAVFSGAGNYMWPEHPSYNVGSPGKALNVTTVGNYDDSTDAGYSTSCYINSEIDNEKPELSAPGTNITAGGFTMTGTSMATPHAAGFAADLMSAYSWYRLRPYYLKSLMLSGSDKLISGGAGRVGVGGLNFYRAHKDGLFGWIAGWWEGDNASFSEFDSYDLLPNNGYVDYHVFIDASASNARVALAWLNTGAYTYAHRADAYPIGIDFDMCVFDPNGVSKGCSASYYNPYELVSFDPIVTGTYRVRISRFANRNIYSDIHMGVSVTTK
jgi:Subtilase family